MEKSVLAGLRAHAMETPAKTALIAGENCLSYGEMYRLVRGFAAYLQKRGLRPGDRLVMRAEQSAYFSVAHYGTQLSGGVFTPIESGAVDGRRDEILAAAGAKLYIGRAREALNGQIDAEKIPALAEENFDEGIDFPPPDPARPAELLFTTGTTGKSKGVLCSHASVVAVAENLIYGMGYKNDTLMLVPGPVNHANGIRKISTAFLFGSAVMLLDGISDLSRFYRALDERPVTALCLAPAAIRVLLTLSKKRLARYADQIDFVETATALLPEADKQAMAKIFPRSRLYNAYGTSEAGSSCMLDYNAQPGLPDCIGSPAMNARFIITDEDGGEIAGDREHPGLIAYGGPMLMTGYYNDPELTEKTVRGGFLFTKDRGYRDAQGRYFLLGRAGDVINVGGRKVAPEEVEQAASRLAGIAECACARMKDKLSGEAPRLFVVMREGAAFNEAEIKRELGALLEDYMLPKSVVQLNALPRSENGKLRRRDLVDYNK